MSHTKPNPWAFPHHTEHAADAALLFGNTFLKTHLSLVIPCIS